MSLQPYAVVGDNALYKGEALEVLRELPSCSMDSIVTDPPAGIAFMGKKWDKDHGGRDGWIAYMRERFAEAMRTVKPGGHALVWALPRTAHWTTMALEDAGWEIRDVVVHLFATGWPKSLDVSKAIERARNEDVAPVRTICRAVRAAMDESGVRSRDLVEHFGGCHPRLIDHWAARDTDSQPSLPTNNQWAALRLLLPLSPDLDGEVRRLNERKGTYGAAWDAREITGEYATDAGGFGGDRFNTRDNLRRDTPYTDAARQWQGWGTALSPSAEHWILCRKPLRGTVAANVLEYGTGAINIDATRIHTAGSEGRAYTVRRLKPGATLNQTGGNWRPDEGVDFHGHTKDGRWPANVVLSCWCETDAHEIPDCPVRVLDEQSGVLTSGTGAVKRSSAAGRKGTALGTESRAVGTPMISYGDTGGASKYFFTAKPSKAERHARGAANNTHPTVKSIALMRWLARLITPPGGKVLDMFGGSGTTGCACIAEGFSCITIESDAEPGSCDTTVARWTESVGPLFSLSPEAADLFDRVESAAFGPRPDTDAMHDLFTTTPADAGGDENQ